MQTPFIVGRIVPPEKFFDRNSEIRRAVSLILTGQSLAFIGEPRIGKTSLLLYLQSPERRTNLYGKAGARLVFYYADSQTWPDNFTPNQFWERALAPLVEILENQAPDSDILAAYRTCQQENYGTFVLERLLARMQAEGWHLVLLLDEFDTLLQHPVLNHTEFYGSLRSLASRYGPALSLVLASRRSLSELNERTQAYTRTGSPFFNFVREIPLRPFKAEVSDAFLAQTAPHFTPEERRYILNLAGGQPYLLQIAGDALWNGYEEHLDSDTRRRYVGEELLHAADAGLRDIWHHWTPEMRKVFTIIALDEVPLLLPGHSFDLRALREVLNNHPRALRMLQNKGFIVQSEVPPGRLGSGYAVTAKVMLWWLMEELFVILRRGDDLGRLLTSEQWLGPFKRRELEALVGTVKKMGKLAEEGVSTLIKAFAEGYGKAMVP